jgi:DNA-binding GntR family transcriptional regulator
MPVPVNSAPIGRLRARELVVERLRAWIVDGELAPGEVVKDTEVATTLGVSRTPVREALLQLEREGLIESQPGRWTRVALLDARLAEQVYAVIVALEGLSAALAAERLAGDAAAQLAPIAAAQERFAAAVARYAATQAPDDLRAVRAADDGFHESVLRGADNGPLADALLPLRARARRFEIWYFGQAPTLNAASVAEHELVLDALRAGDATRAGDAMRHNFTRTVRAIAGVEQATVGEGAP